MLYQFQVYSIQLYIHMYPFSNSFLVRLLMSRVPCAVRQVLLVIHFKWTGTYIHISNNPLLGWPALEGTSHTPRAVTAEHSPVLWAQVMQMFPTLLRMLVALGSDSSILSHSSVLLGLKHIYYVKVVLLSVKLGFYIY